MTTTWGSPVNEDSEGIKTTAAYGDRGDGVSDWFHWGRVADGGDVAQGDRGDAAANTGDGTVIALLRAIRDMLRAGAPGDATLVQKSSGNVAAAANSTAAMPAVSAKTNYCSGILITGAGATAASNITITLVGIAGGTLTFIIAVPAGATVGITPLRVVFDPPIPASAANTAITLTVPSFGTGNTHSASFIQGYVV